MRHLNNRTDHRHSKSRCDQSSPARRTTSNASWCRAVIIECPAQFSSHLWSQIFSAYTIWLPIRAINLYTVLRLTLQWRLNERDGVSNYQPHDCLLNRLFRHRPKKTSKLRVTGLFAGNSPVTGVFPAQKASNAENNSIWWRHHGRGFIQHTNIFGNFTSGLHCKIYTRVYNAHFGRVLHTLNKPVQRMYGPINQYIFSLYLSSFLLIDKLYFLLIFFHNCSHLLLCTLHLYHCLVWWQ